MYTYLLLSTELVAVSHLSMAIVLFIYASRSVAYKAQAWVLMLISLIYAIDMSFLVFSNKVHDMDMLNTL